ncbi:MAG: SCO1664 family protein [Acidimicrobiia bacterium]|nr:SCO1664 family protein [Acidimicrobiia bacterium]
MTAWQPEIAEVLGRLPFASNATLLARSTIDELVVYKPEKGERPLWDFPSGTLAAREVLAYDVSSAAGLDVVPETVLAEGPYGVGSVQRFIDEDQSFDPVPMINASDAALWPIAVFDILANNADRKVGHILRDRSSGRLWSIDHGVTFHDESKLRTVLWAFAGCELPAAMVAAVERLAGALPAVLAGAGAIALSEYETDALTRRIERLRARPVHPDPPMDRPAMPWPLY